MSLRTLRRLSLLALLSFALLSFPGRGPASGQELVDLVIRTVDVEPTKSSGDAWDAFNGKPDLKVTVKSGRKRHTTAVVNNTMQTDFKSRALRVAPGTAIEIIVADDDVAVDDEIGRRTMTLGAEHIGPGGMVCGPFGRVRSLVLEFRR